MDRLGENGTAIHGNDAVIRQRHVQHVGMEKQALAAQIANNFGDADGLQLSSLTALGLLLFVLSFCVLALARWMIGRGDAH